MNYPFLRKLWRIFLWLFGLILLFINGYLISGRLLGRIAVNTDFAPDTTQSAIPIYIISNGIHTDIAVPTKTDYIDWTIPFPPDSFTPPLSTPSYISFGWGEKDLYDKVPTWDKLTTSILINAMLIPSTSSMHVTYHSQPPKTSNLVKKVSISPEQYKTLVDFIKHGLTWDENNQPQNQNCCWYPAVSDNFYSSPPRYHLFQTCNHWTIQGLKEAGLPAPLWTPFPEDIINHLNHVAE